MEVREIALDELIPSKNPRTEGFDISELTESIREHGLLQPIRIRPVYEGLYQIISGHRRFMAHKALGRESIPSVVVEETDESAAVQGIVENLQREDLTPLELARGIQELVIGFQFDIEQTARAVSKSPGRIRTWLRISNLPDDVLARLESGQSGTHRVKGLAPRHVEPFLRGFKPMEQVEENSETEDSPYSKRLSDVREMQDEVERRGVRITAHMADDIARKTREGNMTVSDAIDQVLADPSRYRYTMPPLPSPQQIEAQSFAEYNRIHSELISLAHRLRPEIAASFSHANKITLLERLAYLDGELEAYRSVLYQYRDQYHDHRDAVARALSSVR